MGGTLLVPFVRSFAGITSNERLARETTEKMNGYIALYRGKRIEVHAETSHQAQTIAAGKFKVDGNPYEPLSDRARATFQDEIDRVYGMLCESVSRGRGILQCALVRGRPAGIVSAQCCFSGHLTATAVCPICWK